MLKEANCVTMGIGIESGSEYIRKKLLKKDTSNETYIKAFKNCREAGIRTTADVMIGLPFETEADILQTANFCREVQADSVSLAIFSPYHGTPLHRLCLDEGFVSPGYHEQISMRSKSILKMPQISADKIQELQYKFNNLVFK